MLDQYITNNFTQPQQEIILATLKTLEIFNHPTILTELDELVYNDDIDNIIRLSQFKGAIVSALQAILNHHGIVVYANLDEINLLNTICLAVHKIAKEYDGRFVLDEVNFELTDSNTALDVMSALVALTSPVTDIYDYVTEVDDTFIESMEAHLESLAPVEISTVDAHYLARYKSYLKGRRTGIIFNLLPTLPMIGTLGVNDLVVLVHNLLDDAGLEELTFELVSLILISNVESADLLATLPYLSEAFTDRPLYADDLLSKLEKEIKNGNY